MPKIPKLTIRTPQPPAATQPQQTTAACTPTTLKIRTAFPLKMAKEEEDERKPPTPVVTVGQRKRAGYDSDEDFNPKKLVLKVTKFCFFFVVIATN